MPIFEYRCRDCGGVSEILVLGENDSVACAKCGGTRLEKLMSAHSTLGSGPQPDGPLPGGCCGSPGSCGTPGNCCSQG